MYQGGKKKYFSYIDLKPASLPSDPNETVRHTNIVIVSLHNGYP